jgi:hypothetical protein
VTGPQGKTGLLEGLSTHTGAYGGIEIAQGCLILEKGGSQEMLKALSGLRSWKLSLRIPMGW